jgi:predicted TIM-barrel fold metal-dependent hydrolase
MPRKADLLQTATPQLNGLCQSWGCLKGFDEVLRDLANVIGGVFLQHAPIGGLAPLQWSKEASISFMDDAGIDVAVVSLSTPGVHTGDSGKARALARRCNEFSAELVRSRPDRFGGFACLPMPDIDASLEELSYALDVLGLDGFVLFTNSNGVYLGDPVLEPVFEELERRKTVVYVHPNPSPHRRPLRKMSATDRGLC